MTTPVGSSPGPSFPTEPFEETYVVRSGDTLSAIARKLGLTLADILKANPLIRDPNRIQVGQQLKLPAAGSPLRGAERPATDLGRGLDVFERKPSVPAQAPAASSHPATAASADRQGPSGSGFVSKLKAFWNGLFAPRGAQTASATTGAGGVKLSLGPNEKYRDAVLLGSQRTGIDPAAIAALVDAEAAKVKGPALNRLTDEAFYARHPERKGRPLTKADTELIREWKKIQDETSGTWDPASAASTSTAVGLTQFLRETWKGEARRPGTYLNEAAKQKGLVDASNKIVTGKEADLLALRTDPTLSILAGAEFGRNNLDILSRRRLVPAGASDDEKAKLMYLAHHEGVDGAERILAGTLTDEDATLLLERNVPDEAKRRQLVEKHGGEGAAYRAWLNEYIDTHIVPARFR